MKFDVFVSFRGIDTRRSFVSHLCHYLFKKQIRTFKHEEEERPDEENERASPQVLQYMEESKVVIAVISKNYTASLSCLDELAKIIECKEKGSLVVVPVFYEVDPCDFSERAVHLAYQLIGNHDERYLFGKDKGKMEIRDKLVKVRRWTDVLVELTHIYQTYASGVEEDSAMIDEVMKYISPHLSAAMSSELKRTEVSERAPLPTNWSNHLSSYELITMAIHQDVGAGNRVSSRKDDMDEFESISIKTKLENSSLYGNKYVTGDSDTNGLVRMDRQMKAVETLLLGLDPKDGVGEIGIWGVGGVGKTTLTTCVYEQISPHFQDHHYHNFLNNDDTRNHSLGLDSTCLLEEITRAALTQMSQSLVNVVKAKLGHRKALLVVDGLEHTGQIKDIQNIVRFFGPGSRLIIVTKDKKLLHQCQVKHLYEVESLRFDEALQLFSQFAFKQKHSPAAFDNLSIRAVLIACRLPLALKVFGSFLCGKNVQEWEFELCRLEATQDKCIAKVFSYIRDDDRDELPSYCFA